MSDDTDPPFVYWIVVLAIGLATAVFSQRFSDWGKTNWFLMGHPSLVYRLLGIATTILAVVMLGLKISE